MRRFLALLSLSSLCLALSPLAAPAGAAELDPALLAGMEARSVGPAVMSGRIGDIEAVPGNPSILYVGAATGGLWKSTDAGLTFEPIFDDQPVAAVGAVAVSPLNPDVVWVGTGEGNTRNSVSVGNGVYKSIDAGRTWRHLGLDGTERIHRIVLHPRDPDVAYVAALGPLWGEGEERGVFKTTDGGETWEKVLYVDRRTGAADLAIDPENPEKLFAAMWQHRRWPWFFRSGGPGSGLYVTHDGGASWQRYSEKDGMPKGELGRIGVALSANHPETVYALVEAEESALLRSDDGGRSWRTVNREPDIAQRPFYYADIRVDPDWPNRVYDLASRVRVSNDGGASFERLGRSFEIHGDYQAMWIDPENPEHILIGTDGGMAISRDRGETWRFVTNLPLAQYYHVAVDMERPYNIYGGLQDNGSWRGPSATWSNGGIPGNAWVRVGFGDGFDTRADPEDATRGYSMWQGGHLLRWDLETGVSKPIRPPQPGDVELRFNWNAALALDPFEPGTIYYGSQYVHKSTDRGDSWTVISPDLTTNDPERQRQELSGGLTPDVTGAENFTTLVALAPSPLEPGVLWAGTDDGRLHVTRDGGESWTSVEANVPGVPAGTWVPHIEPSRFDAAEAFVVFDNHRRSDWTPYVYRTRDFGRSWQSLATDELDGYALAIAQDPVDRDLLFLGTEFGLWVSVDGGAAWHKWTHGVPTVSVMDLVVHPRDHDLVLGTHGRSAYVLDDVAPLRTLPEVLAEGGEGLHLFPVPEARQWTARPRFGGNRQGSTVFEGENRPYGALLTFWLDAPGLPHPDDEVEREAAERERERARREAAEEIYAEVEEEEEAEPESPEAEAAVAGEPSERAGQGGRGGRGDAPKAEVTVTDAAGRTVRTFETPVHRGLNRVAWDLGRDPFDDPPGAQQGWRDDASGPELPPGTYTVTVAYGDHRASAPVTVVADPTAANSDADWAAREAAIERAGALQNALAAGVERIHEVRDDVRVLVARAEKAAGRLEEEESGDAEAAVEAGDAEAEGPAAPLRALAEAGRDLQEELDELEKRFWTPPDTRGIVRRSEAEWPVDYGLWSVTASWAPPNPTDLAYLERAEGVLAETLGSLNELLGDEVAAFRRQAAEAGLTLLPELDPVTVGEGR